jgi:hypothetical protein
MTPRLWLPFAIVAALTGSAAAEKQKIAVLGLEVAGAIDYEATSVARNLTSELRSRVRTSQAYALAPNSNKELIDEKVAHGCDGEVTDCMARIAEKLGAQSLLYGRIAKKQQNGIPGYQVELRLLHVDKKATRPAMLWISLEDAVGTGLIRAAERAYGEIAGVDEGGTDAVVVAPGSPKKTRSNVWRPVALVSGAVTVGMFGGFLYTAVKLGDLNRRCAPGQATNGCDKGETWERRSQWLGYGTIPFALVTVYAVYRGYLKSDGGESSESVGARVRKRDRIVVTPIVSPDGAGATVRFDW